MGSEACCSGNLSSISNTSDHSFVDSVEPCLKRWSRQTVTTFRVRLRTKDEMEAYSKRRVTMEHGRTA